MDKLTSYRVTIELEAAVTDECKDFETAEQVKALIEDWLMNISEPGLSVGDVTVEEV